MWVGVAIGIPDPYRAALTVARVDAQDPMAHLIPPHVTLLPPTEIASDELPQLVQQLHEVAAIHDPFVVRLEGTQTFRPVSPVVFVPLLQGGEHCTALQADVNSGVVAQDLRFPYHPHVTIAHEISDGLLNAAAVSMNGFSAEFPVAAFELYQHGDDGVWREMASFRLRKRGM